MQHRISDFCELQRILVGQHLSLDLIPVDEKFLAAPLDVAGLHYVEWLAVDDQLPALLCHCVPAATRQAMLGRMDRAAVGSAVMVTNVQGEVVPLGIGVFP